MRVGNENAGSCYCNCSSGCANRGCRTFFRCGPGTVTLTATVAAGQTIDWYSAATGGSVLAGGTGVTSFTTPSISTTSTYYAEARTTAGSCESATRTPVVATVTASPAAPTAGAGPFTRCGTGTITLTATVAAGETIDWYAAATGGSVLAGGTGVTSFTTPSISTTTTYYAEARTTAGSCESATRTPVVATVTPPPAAPTAGAGPFTRCGPGTVILTATVGAGETIDWYSAATGGTVLAGGTGVTSFTTPSISTTTTYYAEARSTAGSCESTTRTAVVATVTAAPAAPAAGAGPFTRCGPGTVTLTATAGAGETIDWYAAATGGTVLAGGTGVTSFTTPSISTTTTYYAEARTTAGSCESATRSAIVATVTAPPAAPTAGAGPFTRCGTGTVTLTATAGAGETIDWYSAATGGSVLAGGTGVTSFTTPSISATTTYYAEARTTAGSCESATRTAIVATVTAPPAAPTAGAGPFTRCGPGTVTLTATAGAGETIDWYSAATGGSVLAGGTGVTSFTTPSISATTTYYAEARSTAGSCESTTRTAIVATVTAAPAAPTAGAGPFTRCGPGTVSLTATVGAGETIDWYAAATGGTVLAGGTGVTSFTTPSISTTTTYYAEARSTAGSCESATRTPIVVTVTAPPAAPTAGAGPFTRCGPGTVSLTATVGAGETIDWYAAATGGTVLAGGTGVTSFTTPSISTTTTYYAEARSTAGSCESATRTAVVATVTAAPAAPTAGAGPFTRCGPGTLTLTATVGAGETIDWYAAATGGTVLAGGTGVTSFTTPSISTTTTYYAEARSTAGSCESATRTAIVATVTAAPAAPTAGAGPFTRCGPGTVTLTATVPAGETIDWYAAATGGTVLAGGTGVTSFTTPSISTTTTYYAEARSTAGSCESTTRTAIVATVTAAPAPPTAGAGPFTRCGPGTLTLTATVPAGETIDWYAAATGGTVLTGGTGVTSFTTPSISTTTTYYAEARSTAGACVSATRVAIVATVTAAPAVPTAGAGPFSRCGPGTLNLTATAAAGETIDWYASATGGTVLAGGTGVTSFTTPSISATTTYYAESRSTAGSCVSATRTAIVATVTTSPAPPTAGAGPFERCGPGTVTLTATVGAGETIDWYAAATGGTVLAGGTGVTSFTTPSISTNTTYYAETRSTAGTCVSATRTAIVATVGASLAAPTATPTQPTCAVATGTIVISVPAPGAGISYSIDGTTYTNTTGSFTSVAPGTYSVTARNASGCTSAATSVVINAAPSAPAAPTATGNAPATCAAATGTVVVSSPAPAAGITYSIDGTTYTNTTGIFNAAPGVYSVTVRNAAGCTSAATSVTVGPAPTAPAAPTATATPPATCAAATGTITVSAPAPAAGITYSIDGTTYTNTTGVFNAAPGTYNVTVRNAAGCTSAAASVTVGPAPTAPAAPTATATPPATCAAATGTITVSAPAPAAGITYSIDGTTYTNTTGVFNAAPGTYNVTVRNAAGCTSAATSVTVGPAPTAPAAPTATATPPATCAAATGTITVSAPAPAAGITYSIDGTTYTNTTGVFNAAPGTYNVTVRNAAGCTSAATSVTVGPAPTAPAAPTATATPPATCAAATGTITVSAPAPAAGITYSIDGTTYTNTTGVFNAAPGTYNVTVKNAAGCTSAAASVTVGPAPTAPAAPTATATPPATCAVATGTITVSAPAPAAGITYSIDGTTYTNTTGVFNAAPGTYNVTVRNAAGCTSAAASVTVGPAPTAPAAPTATATAPATCAATTGTITVSAPAPAAGITYSIDGTTYTNTTGVFNAAPGTYNVTVRNSAGCTSAAASVVVGPVPVCAITPTFTQIGPLTQNSTPPVLPTTSTNNITGTWNPTTINTATVGTVTYTFTPNAGQGATTATMSIEIKASVVPTFTQLGPFCQGSTPPVLPATSTNGIAGTWSPATISTAAVGTTTYTFTPTSGGTAVRMEIVITSQVAPTFTQLGPFCQNATAPALPARSNNGINGTWSPATINTSAPGTTVYLFTPATGQCGTEVKMEIEITDGVIPTFTQIGPLCQNSTAPALPATSTNSIRGTWSPATISTAAAGTTTYTFTPATGQCGTPTTMSVVVTAGVNPTFTQIGPLCRNSTAPALPAASNNNINGTWNPATINTATVGTATYTFTPATGECGTPVTMNIVVTNQSAPTFTQIGPLCQNTTAPALPTTSTNNIAGSWSPATINTASAGTTTYTFTPSAGECGITTTMSIVVTNVSAPTFTQIGPLCQSTTAPALPTTSTNGISGTWSPATINTSAVGTATYTFTPGAGQCGTTATMTVVITSQVAPVFTTIGPLCQNATAPALPTTSTDGVTGTWSPTSINTAAIGTTNYTFTPAAGQCAAVTTMAVVITSQAIPSFNQIPPLCNNTTPPLLPATSTNGITGTWSPTTINTTTVGTTTFTFTPNVGQCGTTATMNIVVTSQVAPNFRRSGLCVKTPPRPHYKQRQPTKSQEPGARQRSTHPQSEQQYILFLKLPVSVHGRRR